MPSLSRAIGCLCTVYVCLSGTPEGFRRSDEDCFCKIEVTFSIFTNMYTFMYLSSPIQLLYDKDYEMLFWVELKRWI